GNDCILVVVALYDACRIIESTTFGLHDHCSAPGFVCLGDGRTVGILAGDHGGVAFAQRDAGLLQRRVQGVLYAVILVYRAELGDTEIRVADKRAPQSAALRDVNRMNGRAVL